MDRFDFIEEDTCPGEPAVYECRMEQCEDGDYVKYEDFEKLQKACKLFMSADNAKIECEICAFNLDAEGARKNRKIIEDNTAEAHRLYNSVMNK